MKKTILILSLSSLILSCSNNSSSTTASKTDSAGATSAGTDAANNPDAKKGLELVAKNDCFTCHKINEPSVGPAYMAVSQKYNPATPAIIDSLANKVIHGGSGNWGTTNMTPHQTLSKEDAQYMVKYVLSIK